MRHGDYYQGGISLLGRSVRMGALAAARSENRNDAVKCTRLAQEQPMSRARSLPPKRRPRSARHAEPARPPRVRVIVADSQAIDRGGLVGLIDDERDLEVVGEAATLEETVRQCTALDPDVLVLALNLAGQEERPALPAIRAALPKLKVLALAERSSAHCLVLNPPSRRARAGEKPPACAIGTDCLNLAVAQGAMGTLRRTADPEELFRAIRAVASGSAWY